MKLVGLMPARNEDWVIGLSLRALLMWCDAVVVLLHNCTDATRDVVYEVAEETWSFDPSKPDAGPLSTRVSVIEDKAVEWEEMRMRQATLERARVLGGTHMVLVDADEVLTGDLVEPDPFFYSPFKPRALIRSMIGSLEREKILMLPWLQLRGTAIKDSKRHLGNLMRYGTWDVTCVMDSGMWAHQQASTAFLDDPALYWRARSGYDLHHRHPMGKDLAWWSPMNGRGSGLMHLQFVSRRRLLAKQFLYQLTEQHRWPGRRPVSEVAAMYTRTVEESESARLAPVPESWWAPYSHLMQYLHIDQEPWQAEECRRMLAENPGLAAGLNDFGIMKEWGMK